jgi:ligand-binding sensor domain-containing protein
MGCSVLTDGQDNSRRTFTNRLIPYSLSNDIVTRLLVAHNGTFWVATNDGLNRFDAATARFTVYKLEPQRRIADLELVEDPKGALRLGTDPQVCIVSIQRLVSSPSTNTT